MQKLATAIFLFSFLSLAAAQTQVFNSQWNYEATTPHSYLTSDLSITPAFSGAPALSVCTGTPVSVTLNAPNQWNTLSLDAGTSNGANNINQLLAAPNPWPAYNFNVKWVDSGQSNSIYNYVDPTTSLPRYFKWFPTDQWTPFLSGIGITTYPENPIGSKYKDENTLTWFGNGQKYFAKSTLFCNATAKIIISNGGPSVTQTFYGNPISTTNTVLSPGVYTAQGSVIIGRCMPTIRNNGTYPTRTLRVLTDDAFHPTFSASNMQINVSDPFSCSLQVMNEVYTPNPPYANQPMSFSFTLTNNGNKQIRVYNISISAGSQFTNLAISSPAIPFVLNPGQSQIISGTAMAPGPGSATFALSIKSNTTSADCTGQNKTCNGSLTKYFPSISVEQKPDYIIQYPGGAAYSAQVGVPMNITVRTFNNGTAAATVLSTTRASFGASIQDLTNIPALGVQLYHDRNTTVTCPSIGSFILSSRADFGAGIGAINESNENNNVGNATVVCGAALRPDYIIQYPNGLVYNAQVGIPKNITVRTFNNGTAAATVLSTTRASFGASIQDLTNIPALGVQLYHDRNTTVTCPSIGSFILSSRADFGAGIGAINESNENNNVGNATVVCGAALRPDYIIQYPNGLVYNAQVGIPKNITVRTFNNGTAAATALSTTRTSFSGSTVDLTNIPALVVLGYHDRNRTITCTNTGTFTLTSTADYGIGIGAINESNENNNVGNATVVCGQQSPGLNLACSFVNHNSIFFPGDWSYVQTSCTDGGVPVQCPSLNWSTSVNGGLLNPTQTPIVPSPAQSNFSISSSAPTPQTGFVNATCANPNICTVSCNLSLNLSRRPDRCNLTFEPARVPPYFLTTDSSLVNATCFNLTTQTACPSFNWLTNISGGLLTPTFTLPAIVPQSLFTTLNAPLQSGRIWVQSATPGVPLICNLTPISVVSGVGPDYIVPEVIPSAAIVFPGQTITVTVKVKNQGNMNAVNNTVTRIGGSCAVQEKPLQPLLIGQTVTDSTFTCTCVAGGPALYNIVATANVYPNNQYETTYQNNNGTGSFICRTLTQLTCPDFV